MKITVQNHITAPLTQVWSAYTTPADIVQWNAASDDWHTTRAEVDLREGGEFCSRMEAKDGSMGFDFAGTYTKIVPFTRLEYSFGDRTAQIEFSSEAENTTSVRVTFDPENEFLVEYQQQGWQAILDNFKRYVEGK
ncbi:MAG TPA: SRPBCC family protein [Anaerolineales bacterium]|nr:SRPBCC family protein [Anaerolineales bacterium]